jgi:ABC-type sugar transport system ATPase subunit
MNFLAATVGADGSVTLPGTASFRPAPAPASLASRHGKAVTLGIRPEDLSPRESGAGASLAATLDVSEPLGNEALLYWSTPAGAVVSRWPVTPRRAKGSAWRSTSATTACAGSIRRRNRR